jgi:peptide chain release factor 3
VRLGSAHNLFGRDRQTVDEAWPGDILGFVTNAEFRIGDTISTSANMVYREIPRFAPECFAYIQGTALSSNKTFRKGLDHLLAEDIVQAFFVDGQASALPLLGAVGPLQFEVFQYRLKEEYGVETRLESRDWEVLRWLESPAVAAAIKAKLPGGCATGRDDLERAVVLFPSRWAMQYFQQNNADVVLLDTPPAG